MFLSVFSFCDTLMHTLIHLMVSHKSLKLSSLFSIIFFFPLLWDEFDFKFADPSFHLVSLLLNSTEFFSLVILLLKNMICLILLIFSIFLLKS